MPVLTDPCALNTLYFKASKLQNSKQTNSTMAELANIFNNLPADLSEEVFQTLATGSGLKIERIISKGQASPPDYWYDQAQHEWVILMAGEAKLMFESGAETHLKAGDYLNIPAHCKHRLLWTSPECETIWLAVHYD